MGHFKECIEHCRTLLDTLGRFCTLLARRLFSGHSPTSPYARSLGAEERDAACTHIQSAMMALALEALDGALQAQGCWSRRAPALPVTAKRSYYSGKQVQKSC